MEFNLVGDLYFAGGCDIVVTGQNSEYADYDNPRGDLYGFLPFVTVTDCVGNRKRLNVGPALGSFYVFGGNISEREANAISEELVKSLQARWDNFGKLPIRFCDWCDDRPAYGSWAYESYGARDDIMWEREHAYLD